MATFTMWLFVLDDLSAHHVQLIRDAQTSGMPRDIDNIINMCASVCNARYQRTSLAQGTAALVLKGMAFDDRKVKDGVALIFDINGIKWIEVH